jgi:hypothetical protein
MQVTYQSHENMNSSISRLVGLMIAWGVAASLAGYFQLLFHLPPAAVPLLVTGLTVGFSIALRRVEWLRTARSVLGTRGLVAPHLIRFVGAVFLWLHAQGRLPAEFAYPAGWGDILVAAGAAILLLRPAGSNFRRALLVWNVLGAVDLLVALGTAGWLNSVRPGSMIEMAGFPLTLIPLWLVPVMLSTHLLMIEELILARSKTRDSDRIHSRHTVRTAPRR